MSQCVVRIREEDDNEHGHEDDDKRDSPNLYMCTCENVHKM